MVVTVQAINDFFGQHAKAGLRRGKNLLKSNKVECVTFDKSYLHLAGVVSASTRKCKYNVTFELKKAGQIASATCECVRGTKCAHMAALLLKARQQNSSTDLACRWSKKAAPKEGAVQTVASLSRRKSFAPQYGNVDPEVFIRLRECLKNSPMGSGAGVLFLLKEEPEGAHSFSATTDAPAPAHSAPDAYVVIRSCNGDEEHIKQTLAVGWPDVVSIAFQTAGQTCNPEWSRLRRGRLTASRFGAVIRAMGRRGGPAPSKSLLKSIEGNKSLDGVKAIQWGRNHERTAVELYSSLSGITVVPMGMWLHESGCFGASPSPDGLIDDDTVLEVKCPYSFRNRRLAEALGVEEEETNYPYAVFFKGGQWYVNENHEYYHQVQASIHFTRRERAILFVWTPKDYVTCIIPKDPQWVENIAVLEMFYFEYLVPYLRSIPA